MPTLFQLEVWVKAEIAKGKGSLHTNHPVIMEEEQAARIANKPDGEGKQKTKIAWETNDPDCYSLWHKERERYFRRAGGNPVLATECMIMALKIQDELAIESFINAIQIIEDAEKETLGAA